jgi:hypothetical protein
MRGWPSRGTSDPADYRTPLQLRSDRAGGFVVSHYTDANGAMFHIAANGDKTVSPLPYAAVFDVAADGRIWFVRNGMLSVGTRDGAITILAPERGATPPADGPLGSAPLGPISLIAAGNDKVYLLIEEGAVNLDVQPPASSLSRSLRVLTRAGDGRWSVQTAPLFADLKSVDVISAIRAGAQDQLVLLLNQPFRELISQREPWPGATAMQYEAAASVRVRDTAGTWSELGTKPYALSISPNATHGYLTYSYNLDAADLSVGPDGRVWVGGAGAIHTVDAVDGWKVAASPLQRTVDEVGQDGPVTSATFAHAGQTAADASGFVFYDGDTCQVRRLQNDRIATLSGPLLGTPASANAGFVGTGSGGELLFAYGDLSGTGPASPFGRYMALFGLARARVADAAFVPEKVRSLASPAGSPVCSVGTSYWAGTPSCRGAPPAAGGGAWLGMSPTATIARIGTDIVSGRDAGAGAVVGSTLNWPGILNGDAPSGPSGVHVERGSLHLFGTMRTDPPVNPGASQYHEIRLYSLDLATGRASATAGKTIASAAYGGRMIDLSPVIPAVGAGPALVQRRSDGRYWLSNGKEIWLLEAPGQLRRVAGSSASGPVGVDGAGDAARFALIASIRVLPDDRLLIVDQAAHAVRILGDDGKVDTLVGRLNQPGKMTGPLPAALDNPVDAFPVGRDLYIATTTSRNLQRAGNAL